jgi:enoyl-CoA hydratase/carnithine racemase
MTLPGPHARDIDGEVVVRTSPGVVEVSFNRPERHNAFTSATYQALLSVCADLQAAPEVRVVVFRGVGGRAFSAGNEISEFVGVADGAGGVAYEAVVGQVLGAIMKLPQVTVAAVEGLCVGGGLAVATHCDVRLCTQGSRFGYPIARTLGNALSAAVVYRCASIFGESLTREMLLLARLIDADRAHAVGAVAGVLPPDRLDAELAAIVAGLQTAAPATLAATKQQLLHRARELESPPDDDADRLEAVYGSADFREGVRAFLAKEKPQFG